MALAPAPAGGQAARSADEAAPPPLLPPPAEVAGRPAWAVPEAAPAVDIDAITTQVLRRIERAAVAQRERFGKI